MALAFTKCQAAGNDFLIVRWSDLDELGLTESDLPELARSMCDRRQGVGADGLEVLGAPGIDHGDTDASLRIFNSDGSEAEISGNGTRCVAAALQYEAPSGESLRITTRAGLKVLRLIERRGRKFIFDMTMGTPSYDLRDVECRIDTSLGTRTVTVLNVGNPQCVLFVEDFDFDWRSLGKMIENHLHFPARTNVSFVRLTNAHEIDVKFWERGAGETLSSGTGSTGAAVAAILAGKASSPVHVVTPAGDLIVTWHGGDVTIRGPAEIVVVGGYYGYPVVSP
ncbi:MAG: diaminopimelate epimerase [Bryobacterales bacterium]|nr:diaminopimelate epimerase [Bryobacterales bacterium]